MKKYLLPTLVATIVTSTAQAQVRLGIKAGYGFSSYTGPDTRNAESITSLHGGLTLNIPLAANSSFSVQPELLYSQKGATEKLSPGVQARQRQHYADLPVLARLNINNLFLEAGPQVSYLLYARTRTKLPSPLGYSSIDPGIGGYNRFDVGYAAGVGYQFSPKLRVGLRYNGGLLRLRDDGSTVRSVVVQLSAAYTFVRP